MTKIRNLASPENPSKKRSFSTSEKLSQICMPLQEMGIQFCSQRLFKGGEHVVLCNREDWVRLYQKENIGLGTLLPQEILQLPRPGMMRYSFWPRNPEDELSRFVAQLGVGRVFTILERQEEFIDVWMFGSLMKKMESENFYLNNLNALKKFILYFKDKTADIALKAPTARCVSERVDALFSVSSTAQPTSSTPSVEEVREFLKQIEFKRYFLGDQQDRQYLTRREAECLRLIAQGKTMKEAAHAMRLSPKTVEHYMEGLKKKLKCSSKSELIEYFSKEASKWFCPT